MESIYKLCCISRQAHHKMVTSHFKQLKKLPIYVRLMEQTREIHPGMGLRAMYELLEPQGIGRDAFIALGLENGFRLKTIPNYVRTTYSVKSSRYKNLTEGRVFDNINQIWSSDITYFQLNDKTYYIVLLMDVYSRRIIGYSVAEDMRAEHNINALNMALKTRGIKDYKFQLIHHSDKGGQYASDVYTNMLTQYNIGISMCNEVYENTHIERLNDTIKNQYLNRFEMNSKYELVQKLRLVVDTYNNKRPHMSLDGLTPIQYEKNLAKNDKAQNKEMTIFTSEQSKIINGNIQMQLFSN